MVSKKLIKKYKLDQEEIDLLNEEEKDIAETENEEFFDEAIDNLRNRTKLFSIRYNVDVINKIKKKAASYGLNYQTYINLFLYQLANDKINFKIK